MTRISTTTPLKVIIMTCKIFTFVQKEVFLNYTFLIKKNTSSVSISTTWCSTTIAPLLQTLRIVSCTGIETDEILMLEISRHRKN